MAELGTRFTIERVKIGHSLPKAARACALLGDWVIAKGDRGVREAKKRTWGALRGTWVPHDTRDTVIDFVATLSAETELPATRLLRWLGLSPSKYFDWKQRYEQADEHNAQVPRDHWLEAWETPSAKGTGFVQPRAPHEHWHTDIAYLNICGTFYYLCSVLDGCSRANLHWEIRESMT